MKNFAEALFLYKDAIAYGLSYADKPPPPAQGVSFGGSGSGLWGRR